MAATSAFGQLLIVNGQPIIIKDNISLNNGQHFDSDILQQAINDAAESMPSVLNRGNDNLVNSEHILNVESSENVREYVSVLSNDHDSEDTSLISLTLEQAAELGLHFTSVDAVEQDHESNECSERLKHGNQYLISNNLPKQLTDTVSTNQMTCSDITKDVDLGNDGNHETDSMLESFDSPQNQHLSLVPHIVNGTVTYTLELSNHQAGHNSNEFFSINNDNSIVVSQDTNNVENSLNLDLSDISTPANVPFVTTGDNAVDSSKNDETDDLDSAECTSGQTFGFVPQNQESVAFLNLSDVISVDKNISTNIVTHINYAPNTAAKQKLYSNQGGKQNILLKQRNLSLYQKGHSLKSKLNLNIEKCKSVAKLSAGGVLNESVENKLNIDQMSENKSSQDDLSNNCSENQQTGNAFVPLQIIGSNDISTSPPNLSALSDGRQTPTLLTAREGRVPEEVSAAFSRIPVKTDTNKPLGSNENPIKLVQQGTTFHSMQALTEDHISKIKPILHENFEAKVPSKNVVYDPASNTRIIYRIISPEEVSLCKLGESPRKRGRPRKVQLSGEQQAEDVGEGAPPPKKVFARTRSGRLSRPPKHIVRDYKHIRRADAEDSDGAYSDYKSDEDPAMDTPVPAPVDLLPGLSAKTKNNKRNISAGNLCPTCGKIYLGYERMKRHFDKYPDHGSIEYLNTVHSHSLPDSEAENHGLEQGNGFWKKGFGRRKMKGRNKYLKTSDKRAGLKEALDWCSAADVAELAGPAVAQVLSLWEFLLLRVSAVHCKSRVVALYREVAQLATRLRSIASQLFRPLDSQKNLLSSTNFVTVQVEDGVMSELLNLNSGVYVASDEDLEESPSTKPQPVPESETTSVPIPTPVPVSPPINGEAAESQVKSSLSLSPVKKLECKSDDMNESSQHEPQSQTQPFLLGSESIMCDVDDRALVSVDEIVSERLQNFTGSQSSTVDELMKGLNELEHRDNNQQTETEDLMEGFSIVSRTAQVSASTEDLMKSLEHFDSDLNHTDPNTDTQGPLDTDTSAPLTVDTLDFEVLSREFHSNNR